ncbi:hypothetical protein MPER_16302, partial [Moniliophthora perniciosa FA553]
MLDLHLLRSNLFDGKSQKSAIWFESLKDSINGKLFHAPYLHALGLAMKCNALALATLSLSLFAAAVPHKRQRAQVIDRCVEPRTVALTFDDGPWYYIKTLTDIGAKGTFFF